MENEPQVAEPPATYFDRLSILILSIEWIVFGSMHFSLPNETIKQIPEFVPESLRQFVATASGMWEVTTGVLLLVPLARRWAALSSLVLLVIFIPAVYHILANESALGVTGVYATAFRVALMPNNILLAICSVYLWQHPGTFLPPHAVKPLSVTEPDADSTRMATLLVAFLLLMSNCAGFLTIVLGVTESRAIGCIWAMACLAIGALVGFLFSVPKVNTEIQSKALLLPNTNIEEISNWLTKMIVGIGLVNFKSIGEFIENRSQELAASLHTDTSYALALIVYFLVIGLIQGNVLTRMFLAKYF
jgi:uncharacterized membrane protein/uncharacterized protein YneF (UPF0154 family)